MPTLLVPHVLDCTTRITGMVGIALSKLIAIYPSEVGGRSDGAIFRIHAQCSYLICRCQLKAILKARGSLETICLKPL
jgi:hypothetical protein